MSERAARDADRPAPLAGSVAVVTGASKGIGRALAFGLARSGARGVIVNYKTDQRGAAGTCNAIREIGTDVVAVQGDVGISGDVERVIAAATDRFGRLDVLVNNAGRTRFGPAGEVTGADWDDVIGTNLYGPFAATVAAVEAMGGGGSVINVSSIAATLALPYHAIYSASKGGLEAMTRQLALEYAPRGVRVNAIAPGATSMERNWEYDADFDESWAEVTPMGRAATPEDYVGPAVFLASPMSAFITGEVLHVDGGWTLTGGPPAMAHYDFTTDRQRG